MHIYGKENFCLRQFLIEILFEWRRPDSDIAMKSRFLFVLSFWERVYKKKGGDGKFSQVSLMCGVFSCFLRNKEREEETRQNFFFLRFVVFTWIERHASVRRLGFWLGVRDIPKQFFFLNSRKQLLPFSNLLWMYTPLFLKKIESSVVHPCRNCFVFFTKQTEKKKSGTSRNENRRLVFSRLRIVTRTHTQQGYYFWRGCRCYVT